MSLPVKQKTWTISPNNRIAFVSLLDTMQRYLHGVKTFLKAQGYTVKGSASAGTGAMDGVDRWTATTDVTPRATIAGASQAWIVLVDGSGVEILIAYQGASDDVCRLSMCADGVGFAAAGTPNQQPTSTGGTEQVLASGLTIIGSAASGDRLWNGWCDSTHKMCRFAIATANNWIGRAWGVELVSSVAVSPAVFSPTTWGFAWGMPNPGVFGNGTSAANMGVFRVVVSSVSKLCTAISGCELFATTTIANNIKAPAQGGAGYLMQGISFGTNTAGAEGKYANLFDHWNMFGSNGTIASPGDVLGTNDFIDMGIAMNGNGIVWWPWDHVTTPVMV